MIIVLFHALYFLGKYVYDHFHPRIDKTEDIKPAVQLLNVTEADYRDPIKSEHIANDEQNFVVKFFPPVYVQRYTTVLDVLASPQYFGKIKKVIDFGCAELSFAVLLKNAGIEEIYCVDIDRSLLENYQSKVAPLHCDYLSLRTEPLSIHVCEGSIAHNDKKLEHTDAVICIELIEHLYPDDLDAFPHNVFGFIKPQVAIVTTPNADFNVLFKDLNGFRHADHKFEWTRTQFQDWANNIVLRYPDYGVSFHGIGSGPGGTEHLGSCSQMAVFHRHSESHDERPEGVDDLLKTVVSHKYPYRVDNRSDEEKILDEAVYYIRLYSAREEEYSEEIPLKQLMFSVEKFRISVEILKSILAEANWGIVEREDGPAVLVPPQSTFSTYSGADFDDFLETDYRHNGDDNDWDTLEQGAPQSGYLFDTYMEGDPWDNEERENWDDPTQETLNSENLQNSELLDQTSDSQWTMEDLNNEDMPIDASQQPQDTTSRSIGPETELPSDSLSIGLDPSDVDYLNASIGTIDLSEHDVSSMQSLGTDSRLVSNEIPALARNSSVEYLQCGGSTCTERSDGPISPQHKKNENQACFHILTIENDRYEYTLQDDVRSISEEAASSCPQDVAEIDETDCNSVCNESSSVSTIEATCLLSHEQSLVGEKDEESLRNDQMIDSIKEKPVTSLSENDEYYDMCSINIQPSCTSDNSLYAQNEISHMSTRDLSSDRNESYKNLDISYDSIDSSYQKSEADLIRIKKLRSEEIKSQDSMSFKSISDCSLDLKPKYTSSPQVCTNDKIQVHEDRRFLDEQNRKSTFSASRTEPRTVQSLDIKDKDFGNEHDSGIKRTTTAALESQNDENVPNREYLSEGEKIDENDASNNFERVSPNTSQLSLQSNSDISLSTAPSTGSSNVEKWYSAEANPMYRRDLVALKGGNDTADNPTEETSDSDVTSVSSSERGRESEPNKVKERTSKTSDRCYKPVRNSQPQDKLKEVQIDDSDRSKKYYPDDLLRGKMNDKLLPCFLGRRNRIPSIENSRSQSATMKDISSMEKMSLNIVLNESIGTQNEPIVMKQTISSSFAPDCQRIEQTIHRDLENEKNSDEINIVLRKADTSGAPTSSSKANSSVDQKDVYEVTKTLAESTKKLFEKVDATRSTLESSLETTKKLAEIIPLVAGKTDSDVGVKSVRMVNDFQNSSRQRPFLFSGKDSDDNEHQAERLSDLRPFGFRTQIRNEDFQILDVSGGISTCKPTTSIGASAPCNVSKIGVEKSQVNNELDVARGFENVESNEFSPESLDTPPNSWSPEIMDSGYPNSASVHDSTPEYEVSSIGNDRISDSDSASIEDMPVPAAYEFLEVENGDLANNNRDDEGNNVIAFQPDDLDDLQPLIDVLENDMENENDIYVLQNGFPMWLLRILEMANPVDLEGIGVQQAQLYPAPLEQAGGDAANVNAENDEGFDSSSSEDESDIDDDEADDATTVSSDETDEQSAENIVRDWRAGGDP